MTHSIVATIFVFVFFGLLFLAGYIVSLILGIMRAKRDEIQARNVKLDFEPPRLSESETAIVRSNVVKAQKRAARKRKAGAK